MAEASVSWRAGLGPGYLIMQRALRHNNQHHTQGTGVHVSHAATPDPQNPMGSKHTVTFPPQKREDCSRSC